MHIAAPSRLSANQCNGIAAAALVGIAFVAFVPALRCDFVNFDDPFFVEHNQWVQSGLSLAGFRWALTTPQGGYWHPLTWLSLQLDATLWKRPGGGADARGFHLTNVALHSADAALLFMALQALTGRRWRSFAVALLFAVHPLRVESVAWITERKDVLSMFFGLLALWAYVHFVRAASMLPMVLYYLGVCFGLLFSLSCKPMFVTFPCLLLVLDWWPLGRARAWRDWPRLIAEKTPLFLLVAGVCWITYSIETVKEPYEYSLAERISNALVSYAIYLAQTAWPTDLAVFYPFAPAELPRWEVAASAALVAIVTAVAVGLRRQAPYLLVGWLWYLGCLAPVIGLIQAGAQAHADRYTYFPQIGILMAVCWSTADLLGQRTRIAFALTGAVALVLTAVTWNQQQYWQDSLALWTRAVQVTRPNHRALASLGTAYEERHLPDKAALYYREAIEIDPNVPQAYLNLGAMAAREGNLVEADRQFATACRVEPQNHVAHSIYAGLLSRTGRLKEAAREYEAAIRIDPDVGDYYSSLGRIQMKLEDFERAADCFRKAVRANPETADYHQGLGIALIRLGRAGEGLAELSEAIRRDPRSGERHLILGQILERQGDARGAVPHFLSAVQLNPELAQAWFALGMQAVRKGDNTRAAEYLSNAVLLDSSSVAFHKALEAVLERLAGSDQKELADRIRQRTHKAGGKPVGSDAAAKE
jgi:protein O-mannosyl-transferase